MRSASLFLAVVLVACSSDGKDDDSAITTPTGTATGTSAGTATGTGGGTPTGTTTGGGTPTGSTTAPATISASCAPTANALRFLCDVTVDPAQPVDLHFSLTAGGPEHTFSSEDVANDHEILVYMMKPSTSYDYRVVPRDDPGAEATGSFVSGAVSDGCDISPVLDGTSSSPYFLFQSPCVNGAYVIVMDGDGDVVWCENFQPGALDPMIEGTTFTEEETILAVVGGHVIEKDFEGNELLRLEPATHLTNHVHHDVFRKNGLTYVLFNENVFYPAYPNESYLLDGFYVFQGTTLLDEWHLADHFTPQNPPTGGWPGRDYSHANAVWADDFGNLFMSFRHLSALARLRGDPVDPYFGEIDLVLSDSTSEWTSDLRVVNQLGGNDGFQKQHNPHLLPNGDVALFDNRTSIAEHSRLLHIDLSPGVADEAHIIDEYELPLHCDFQGGSWHTSTGNPVATCAPQRKAYEWDVGAVNPRFELSLECTSPLNTYVPRVIPWDGPW